MHDLLVGKGVRDRSTVSSPMPLGQPIPPSQALLQRFGELGIGWYPDSVVTSLDPPTATTHLSDGRQMPYDLFLAIPVHRAPRVVVDAGLTVHGWIPVDSLSLGTRCPGVYAVGM
jgi:sulfide:quinone oxidoreductase